MAPAGVYVSMSTDIKQRALDFIRATRICHMTTIDGDKPSTRVMSAGRVDADFTVWFAVFASSGKVRQLAVNPHLSLSLYDGKMDCTIDGAGAVINDQAVKDELWNDHLAEYYTGGKSDPEYAILKVTPHSVRFRDFSLSGQNPVELIQ